MLLFGFIGLMFDLALGAVYLLIRMGLYLFPIFFVIYLIRNAASRNY